MCGVSDCVWIGGGKSSVDHKQHVRNNMQSKSMMSIDVDEQPVVPLRQGCKSPILKGWSQVPAEDLVKHGSRDLKGNWSVRCDRLVVVDVDAKPANADKACMDMDAFRDQVFAMETYIVKTRSGNPHAYFVYEESRMGHWKRRLGVYGFVDVLLGANSLVVAAGSVVDGKTYEVHGPAKRPIGSMPQWLYERLDAEMRRSNHEEGRRKSSVNLTEKLERRPVAESPEELNPLLIDSGYQEPCLKRNAYGGYDIVFGYPHKCLITGQEHEQIDGYIFRTSKDNILMAGCYSDRCKGHFKRLDHKQLYQQPEELARLIDNAAEKNTHYDIASVAVHLYKDTIKYAGSEGWFHFDPENGLWKQDREGDEMRVILSTKVSDEFARRILFYNEKQRHCASESEGAQYNDWYRKLTAVMTKLGDAYHKSQLIKEAQGRLRDPDFLDRLDDGPFIGFNNGVYDLDAGEFRKGRPQDRVSLSVGYDYPEPDSIDPEALEEVRRLFSDPFESPEMPDYLFKTLASCLDGRRKVAELYVWTGVGSNGKSTIQELVMATMDRYAQPLDINFWTRPKGAAGAALPELADKRPCRFVFSNEPEATDKLQVAKLKEVTGGERITARRLYGDPITYRPRFGIFILANTLPELSKVDGGISRRLRVVPFVHQFRQFPLPGQRQARPAVMDNCRNNVEWRRALMFLLLDAYRRIKGLEAIPLPAEVLQANEDYLEDNNPVGRFLAENFVMTGNQDHYIRASELFAIYTQITRDRMMTLTAFGSSMTHVNQVPKKKKKINGVTVWVYLGLSPQRTDGMDLREGDDVAAV
jgi:P4 family phage/plasmid primase-like protien